MPLDSVSVGLSNAPLGLTRPLGTRSTSRTRTARCAESLRLAPPRRLPPRPSVSPALSRRFARITQSSHPTLRPITVITSILADSREFLISMRRKLQSILSGLRITSTSLRIRQLSDDTPRHGVRCVPQKLPYLGRLPGLSMD